MNIMKVLLGMEPYIVLYTSEGKIELTRNEWMLDRTPRRYHRTDGPAIVPRSGWDEWYLDGEEVSRYEHARLVQEVKNMPLVLRLVDPRKWVREYKEEIINV